MYRSLVRQGKLEDRGIKFVAFGGDGGTYDIGLQSLSGALERGHQFLYVCYDNQGYMNTGIQRSSATPHGAATTTSPAGTKIPGKSQFRKDLTAIAAAHHIPYVAQASIHRWKDLMTKVRKAVAVGGPSFINVYAPCNRGWRVETQDAVKHSKLAVDCCFWPLYEVEYGEWHLNYMPRKKLPVKDWMKSEGRFKHLFNNGRDRIIEELQDEVDRRWEDLMKRCGEEND
jgi:pyruvate ferredoxin oxidoreductase beta subunit